MSIITLQIQYIKIEIIVKYDIIYLRLKDNIRIAINLITSSKLILLCEVKLIN